MQKNEFLVYQIYTPQQIFNYRIKMLTLYNYKFNCDIPI